MLQETRLERTEGEDHTVFNGAESIHTVCGVQADLQEKKNAKMEERTVGPQSPLQLVQKKWSYP